MQDFPKVSDDKQAIGEEEKADCHLSTIQRCFQVICHLL
jgi:hypothetical protein